MQHLIVVRPFGPWRIGDIVSDAAEMFDILGSEHAEHVVRIQAPEGT